MALTIRVFAIVILSLILAFSLIHLGVSIGIIVQYRKYNDIFRPQVGLASFNLVICFFGFATGILGLLAIRVHSTKFGRIAALIATVLFVFTIASLVAAIVINAKSLNYLKSHLLGNMYLYDIDADVQQRLNDLQDVYDCCGADGWTDWSSVKLRQPPGTANSTTTTMFPSTLMSTTPATTNAAMSSTSTNAAMSSTSTNAAMSSTSTNAVMSSTSTTGSSTVSNSQTTQSITSSVTNAATIITASNVAKHLKRELSDIIDNISPEEALNLMETSRNKRDAASVVYGNIYGLPLTFSVVLPDSCCGGSATMYNYSSAYYCLSNANGVPNDFTTKGCLQPVDVVAGNQALGFGVINSFLVILAFSAILLMLEVESFYN